MIVPAFIDEPVDCEQIPGKTATEPTQRDSLFLSRPGDGVVLMCSHFCGRRCLLSPLSLLLLFLIGCHSSSAHHANFLGKTSYRAGNYGAAEHEFRRAAFDNPRSPSFVHNLATVHRKQGRAVEAEQEYRRALQLNAEYQPSHHGLVLLLRSQNRSAEAVRHLEQWAARSPRNAAPYVELAWLQRTENRLTAAEQSLRQAVSRQPNHPAALAHLGELYQAAGQPDRAMEMYQQSLANRWEQPKLQKRVAALQKNRLAQQRQNTDLLQHAMDRRFNGQQFAGQQFAGQQWTNEVPPSIVIAPVKNLNHEAIR